MPGRVHVHKVAGKRALVYHRASGPVKVHSVEHSKFSLSKDNKRSASSKRIAPHGYPHSGPMQEVETIEA